MQEALGNYKSKGTAKKTEEAVYKEKKRLSAVKQKEHTEQRRQQPREKRGKLTGTMSTF